MGWAERSNPKSEWNKKRAGLVEVPCSTQTTQKQKFIEASTPINRDEPVIVQLTLKNLWGILCHRLNLIFRKHSPSHAPTS